MQYLAFSLILTSLTIGNWNTSPEPNTPSNTDRHAAVDVEKSGTTQPEEKPTYSYKAALKKAQKSNRPFVVIVTATWCAPCQVMKNQTIKQVMREDGFDDVILAFVDVDQEPALAQNLTKGQGIPHVVVFEKKEEKWKRRTLFGMQTAATLKAFIKPRFALNSIEKMAEAKKETVKR